MTLVFLVWVAAPLVGQLGGHSDIAKISDLEWRKPNPAPTRPTSAEAIAEWPEAAEGWINDAFGFRMTFISLNQRLLVHLRSTGSDTVTLGESGWMFHRRDRYVDIEAEHRGAVAISDEEIEAQVRQLASQSEWVAQQGMTMIAALVPDKQSVYPEYLPEWARQSRPTRTDRVVASLRALPQLTFVDTRPALVAAKEGAPKPLYYLTDTHWNHHGAYVAYREIMAAVSSVFPGVNVVDSEDFELTTRQVGTLDLMRKHNFRWGWVEPKTEVILRQPSHVVAAWSFVNNAWRRSEAEDAAVESNTVFVRTDLAAAPRVLLVRDSYTNALAPFLNESFQEVLYVHGEGKRTWRFVHEFAPDLVLRVFLEKALAFRVETWRPPQRGEAVVPLAEQLTQRVATPGGDDLSLFGDGFDSGVPAGWGKVVE